MANPEPNNPLARIDYTGDIHSVLERLCDAFDVGQPSKFFPIETGFEDCNLIVQTDRGKFVTKIFSKERTGETISRYGEMMENVMTAGVSCPFMYRTRDGGLVFRDESGSEISAVLMKYVDGSTFLDLGRAPNTSESEAIIEQVSLLHRIEYEPSYLFDSWSVQNIRPSFEVVREFLLADDVARVATVVRRFEEIPIDRLPRCFVHGDLTQANVLKGKDGKVYLIDFSVANRYPRIQDLAVIVANLMHESGKGLSLRRRAESVADMYERHSSLTIEERESIYAYSLAAAAMEFLGACRERFVKGNDSEEVSHWLEVGRESLATELA